MGDSGLRKVRIAVTIILMLLFFLANIYAIRQGARYVVELYFYDKLLVGYQSAGMPGLRSELERIVSEDKFYREIILLQNFKQNLANLQDPGSYLKSIVKDKKQKIIFFKHLRDISLGLIMALFLARLALDIFIRRKKNEAKI